MLNEELIRKYAAAHESCYLYSQKEINASLKALKTAFPHNPFLYSVKCNPESQVLDTIFSAGLGADTASTKETLIALEHGLPPEKIYFSAPGKTSNDIECCLGKCILTADSLNEIKLINRIAAAKSLKATIGVRLNPAFAGSDGKCAPSKFGIDEPEFIKAIPDLLELRNVSIIGLHIHVKSQRLENADITRYWRSCAALFGRVQKKLPTPMTFLNVGSGIGVPYSSQQKAPDLEALGKSMTTITAKLHETWPDLTVFIESGRFITCKAGTYLTHVTDNKVSAGTNFLILADTLNGFVRPSMAIMASDFAQGAVPACEPMVSGGAAFEFTAYTQIPSSPNDTEVVTICGSLCTGADVVARNITLPRMLPGDIVTINNAGAYAQVLTPSQFASRLPPAEILVPDDEL